MLNLLTALLVAAASPAPASIPAALAEPLHCRVDARDTKRRCAVTVPIGRAVRACAGASAKSCDASNKYLTRVVETGGARCRISKKHTDWERKVAVTMSKKSSKLPGAACDLYVEVT